jgi:hypothetical protein
VKTDRQVWIGLVHVRPMPGCGLLENGEKGAFTWVLTWAGSAGEYETKVRSVLEEYQFFSLEVEDVQTFSEDGDWAEDIYEEYLRVSTNREWTVYTRFHTYAVDD